MAEVNGDKIGTWVEKNVASFAWATLVIVGLAVVWLFLAKPGPGPDLDTVGQWLSGIVQPIAVFWFVMALFLQRAELRVQRRELELTRNEITRQSEALQSSDLTSKRASFVPLRAEYQGMLDNLVKPLEIGIPEKYRLQNIPMVDAFMFRLYDAASTRRSYITASLAQEIAPHFELSKIARNYVQVYEDLLEKAKEADFSAPGDNSMVRRGPTDGVAVGIFERRVRSTYHHGWYTLFVVLFNFEMSRHYIDSRTDPDFVIPHRDRIMLHAG